MRNSRAGYNSMTMTNASSAAIKTPSVVMQLADNKQVGAVCYGKALSPFGEAWIAWTTDDGICELAFGDDWQPHPDYHQRDDAHAAQIAGRIFNHSTFNNSTSKKPLVLHVAGTDFQCAVWQALLTIPSGEVTAYSALASQLGKPKAVRAVANAVGANKIAWLIPCHRVIRRSGELGGYRWGLERKRAMLAAEKT